MLNFLSKTNEIIAGLHYHASSEEISSFYPAAFNSVKKQILKLETKQVYREPAKPYDTALLENDIEKALSFIPFITEANIPIYTALQEKGVEYIRCRPIEIPLTSYTKWEIKVFHEISKIYEKIYLCLYSELETVFDNHACHDFMVFDSNLAIIQNYDDSGLLRGGWVLKDEAEVIKLITLFGYIKANCSTLSFFDLSKISL